MYELQYTSLLKHVYQFKHFRILTIGLSTLLERVPSYVPTPWHGFWSSILRYLCPLKNILFRSFWWRHCMWFVVWAPPQLKILATPLKLTSIFCSGYNLHSNTLSWQDGMAERVKALFLHRLRSHCLGSTHNPDNVCIVYVVLRVSFLDKTLYDDNLCWDA